MERARVLTVEGMVSLKVRVVLLDVAGRRAVPLHVVQEVPAFGFIKDGEEQGELLHSQLPPENEAQHPRAADDQGPNESRVQVLLLPGSQGRRMCLRGVGSTDASKQHSSKESGGPVFIPGLAPTHAQDTARAGWEGHAAFTGESPLCPYLRKAVQQVFAHVFQRSGACLSSCPTVPTPLTPRVTFSQLWQRHRGLQNANSLQVS